jgi:hypothetical protein
MGLPKVKAMPMSALPASTEAVAMKLRGSVEMICQSTVVTYREPSARVRMVPVGIRVFAVPLTLRLVGEV